jgi:tetratricopeptide (TPR) repeat protein
MEQPVNYWSDYNITHSLILSLGYTQSITTEKLMVIMRNVVTINLFKLGNIKQITDYLLCGGLPKLPLQLAVITVFSIAGWVPLANAADRPFFHLQKPAVTAYAPLPAMVAANTLTHAVQLYRQGHFSQAQAWLQSHPLADNTPERPQWLYYQALCATQLGQWSTASQWYESLIAHYPDTEGAHLAEAGLQYLQQRMTPTGWDRPPQLTQHNPLPQHAQSNADIAGSPYQAGDNSEVAEFLSLMGGATDPTNTALGKNSTDMINPNLFNQNLFNPIATTKTPGLQNSQFNSGDPAAMSQLLMQQWLGQINTQMGLPTSDGNDNAFNR